MTDSARGSVIHSPESIYSKYQPEINKISENKGQVEYEGRVVAVINQISSEIAEQLNELNKQMRELLGERRSGAGVQHKFDLLDQKMEKFIEENKNVMSQLRGCLLPTAVRTDQTAECTIPYKVDKDGTSKLQGLLPSTVTIDLPKVADKSTRKLMKQVLKDLYELPGAKEKWDTLCQSCKSKKRNPSDSPPKPIKEHLEEIHKKIKDAKANGNSINEEEVILSLLEYPELNLSPEKLANISKKQQLNLTKLIKDLNEKKRDKINELKENLLKVGRNDLIKNIMGNEGVLDVPAVKMLVEKNKVNHPNMNCIVCESPDELADQVAELSKSDFVGKASFIVYSGRVYSGAQAYHVTPVLIEKKADGTMKIAILDSLGNKDQELGRSPTKLDASDPKTLRSYELLKDKCMQEYEKNIYYALRKHCMDKKMEEWPEIHILSKRRQAGPIECPFFAVNDVVQFTEHPDFFGFIEQHGGKKLEKYHDGKVTYFSHLPSEFMKLTQNIKYMDEHKEIDEFDLTSLNTSVEEASKENTRLCTGLRDELVPRSSLKPAGSNQIHQNFAL